MTIIAHISDLHFGREVPQLIDGLIVSHASTAILNRLTGNGRNSFKVVRGNRRKIEVETWEWNGTSFTAVERLSFKRVEERWRKNL